MQNQQRTMTRAETTRAERRRKPGSTVASGLKLHVPQELLDSAYEYRWVNDEPGRIQMMYEQDWDKVEDARIAGEGNGGGTVPTKFVGSHNGPTNAVLMRKRKEWYAEDQKEKRKPLDEMDKAIRRGTAHHQQNDPDLPAASTYTPGSNTLSRA